MATFKGLVTLRGTASEGVIAIFPACPLEPPVSTLRERLPGGGNLNEESDDESSITLNGGTAALSLAANVLLARLTEK
jgi:hypothetical protein